jgi:hypothetical protein
VRTKKNGDNPPFLRGRIEALPLVVLPNYYRQISVLDVDGLMMTRNLTEMEMDFVKPERER